MPKEELFRAVMYRDVQEEADQLVRELLPEQDLRTGLISQRRQ